MEYCLPQLLSRDEIIHILHERQLQIPNIDELTNQELLRVYSTFVVPLAKRESKASSSISNNASAVAKPVGLPTQRIAAKRHSALDINKVHLETLNINDEVDFNKRIRISETNLSVKKDILTDCNSIDYGSVAKKRKVITWP